MKKEYGKPRICYESFTLSNSISSGCEGIANLGEQQCSITIPGLEYPIFTSTPICEITPPGGNDQICYHVPTDWNNVFSS